MTISASLPRHAQKQRGSRRERAVWIAVAVIVFLLVTAAAWVGLRGMAAKAELEAAVPLASTIQKQTAASDSSAAKKTYLELAQHTKTAANLTGDPVWRAAEILPWAGPNLAAMRQLTSAVDAVTQGAIKPLTSLAGSISLNGFKPVDGAIDIKPIAAVLPQLKAADAVMKRSLARVHAVDTSGVIGPVRGATVRLEKLLASAGAGVDAATSAATLIPAMLGVDGPRNYLLLFQNPAELRSTGGIPGAVALVHTENGHLSFTQQASSADFPHYEKPVLDLPVETRSLYGDITGQYIQDVNLTPNFPLSGKLAREMWRQKFGVETDGVLSIDPVALGYLLKATGPITLPTGDVLSSDNAVKLLLGDVYARYTRPADQDAFFAGAAASVFSAVSSGKADPKALIEALAKAGG